MSQWEVATTRTGLGQEDQGGDLESTEELFLKKLPLEKWELPLKLKEDHLAMVMEDGLPLRHKGNQGQNSLSHPLDCEQG